jgi:FAD/FMN-containing dehydrogenase
MVALEDVSGGSLPHCSSSEPEHAKFLFVLTDVASRFSGSLNTVKDSINAAQALAKAHQCTTFEKASTKDEMDALWSARKVALLASLAGRPEGTQLKSTDVAVPLSRMAEIIGKSPRKCLHAPTRCV